MRSLGIGVLALALLPLSLARGQEDKKPADAAQKGQDIRNLLLQTTPEQLLKRLDKNGDEALSQDELPPFLAQGLEKADRNGDGKLDREELAGVLQFVRQRAAQDQPKTPLQGGGAALLKRALEQMDANGDGKISKEEAKGKLAEKFAEADTNGDGVVDRKEMQSLIQRFAPDQPAPPRVDGNPLLKRILDNLDTNGDGKISKEEAKGPLAQNFEKADANGDGELDRKELQALAQRLGPNPANAPKLDGNPFLKRILDDMDANGDGKISKEEAKGRIAEGFGRIDTNNDGVLDRAELQRVLQLFQPPGAPGGAKGRPGFGRFNRPPDFDALDKDADGRLTAEELANTPFARTFAQIDANNDGRLTREEFENFTRKKD